MRVDLPAPFSPTSAWISPRRSSKRQLRSAWTPGKSLLIPSISTSRSPTASDTTPPIRTDRGRRRSATAPRPLLARSFGLLVQQRRDVRRVDVRLVVPVEARVDVLRYRLLVQHLPGRLDRLEPDADRVLGDRAGLVAAANRVHLLLAGVIPDDHDLARLTRFLHAVEHADGRTLVRPEDALEVRVRLQDRFRDIRRFELVATAVLSRDDLDVRVLALDLVGEALDAVDAGAARLVMRDDRDVAAHADEGCHLVRRRRGRRDVVRRRGRYGDVAVDTGVEADDRNVLVL